MAASSSATAAAASSGLTREASIYSWTIDELHSAVSNSNDMNNNNHRGVGSMNMDELLRNICSAEESYAVGGDPDPGIGSSSANLGRQGSLTLPRSIVNKTVEEVWKEIQTTVTATATANANGGVGTCNNAGETSTPPVQRELTLGEMTLEDFLAKAGVVREDTLPGVNTGPHNLSPNAHDDWLDFQYKAAQGPQALVIQQPQQQIQNQQIQRQAQQPLFGKSPAAAGVPVFNSSSTGSILEATMESGATSSFVPTAFGNGVHRLSPASARGKKRAFDAPEDKAVEQRQRRMIKNRESAARSRERKQAYTVELEAQVTQLKEENAELSRLEEEEKRKRFKQLMETLIPVEEMRKPPRVLRRTRTAHW